MPVFAVAVGIIVTVLAEVVVVVVVVGVTAIAAVGAGILAIISVENSVKLATVVVLEVESAVVFNKASTGVLVGVGAFQNSLLADSLSCIDPIVLCRIRKLLIHRGLYFSNFLVSCLDACIESGFVLGNFVLGIV